MSRSERRNPLNKSEWATCKVWAISGRRYKGEFAPASPVVILHDSAEEHPLASNAHVGLQLTRAAAASGAFSPAVFVMDYSALAKDIGKEQATAGVGPVSKPLLRMFTKLNGQGIHLVASGDCCFMAAKLLSASPDFCPRSRLRPAHRRAVRERRSNRTGQDRVWRRFPPQCLRAVHSRWDRRCHDGGGRSLHGRPRSRRNIGDG